MLNFRRKTPEKLANLVFVWYDFRGFVYPFLSRKKLPATQRCNFDVTNERKRAGKRNLMKKQLRTTKRGVKT
jgi:RNase P protein component